MMGNIMRHKLLFFIALLTFSQMLYADTVNIQLSNESARFSYAAEVFGGEFGPTELDVGAYFNEHDDTVVHGGLLVRNDSLDNPIRIGIGLRAYYADAGNQPGQTQADVGVIAIGGEIKFTPDNFGGIGFGLNYFVSPSVLSFMDADGFTEFSLIADYNITEAATVYIGYRKMQVKLDTGGSFDIESSFIYGLMLRF